MEGNVDVDVIAATELLEVGPIDDGTLGRGNEALEEEFEEKAEAEDEKNIEGPLKPGMARKAVAIAAAIAFSILCSCTWLYTGCPHWHVFSSSVARRNTPHVQVEYLHCKGRNVPDMRMNKSDHALISSVAKQTTTSIAHTTPQHDGLMHKTLVKGMSPRGDHSQNQ